MNKRLNADKIVNKIIPVDLIDAHKDNYNQHPEEQISQLAASHADFGQYRSIVVVARPGGRYVQVAGHGYLQAAKGEGLTQVRCDVLPADTPDETIKAIMISDNEHARNSTVDDEVLAQLLQEQADAGFDLAALGTDEETLRQMLEALGDGYLDGGDDEEDDEIPEEVETRVKLGDIWQLDKHRIACLDAINPATYEYLLSGIRPHAIITDAPYGMRLDTDFSSMQNNLQFIQDKGVKSGRKYAKVIGDSEDFDASPLVTMFADVKEQFWFGADYYSSTLGDTMHTGCWLVWDKRLDESADKMYGSCFELIWSKQKHKRDMLRHKWAGVFGTEHEPQRGRQHPTQKPVRLMEDIITRYTDEEQIILDPFLGSGTTLISAQRTGRVCYGCELSPAYCDVILSRWEAETGQTAQLIERVEEAANG